MAAVNRPVDVEAKEADVNRKLQLYGILNAFQNGKVPSNEQIDVALNSFLESKALASPPQKLSSEGKALIHDFKEVVKQAKYLVLSKNEGNILQDFIWQTQRFDPKAIKAPGAPVDKATAQQHGDQALESLRTLGTLIITNGQFRKLLKDATVLLRDMAGDAAGNAANRLKPNQDDLAQLDKPAEDNTWHDKPDLSGEHLKKQAQAFYKGSLKNDVKDAAVQGAQTTHPSGSSDPHDLADIAIRDQQTGGSSGVDVVGGAHATKNTLKEKIAASVDNNTTKTASAKAREYRERAKKYFGNKVPQERREQTVLRLKKMIVECQQHPDYQRAISTLLDLAGEYSTHANRLAQGGTGTVKETRSGLAQAEKDLKTLIERCANGTSMDNLWESIRQIYKDADKDEELKNWFKAVDRCVRRSLQEEGYILDDESTEDWNRLYDRGNFLLREKYRAQTDRVVDEIKFLGDQFDQDDQNKAFAAAVTKLFTDLGNDENGKPTFKPHLIKDLTEVILPAVFENVAYIPVPRIEYSDHQIDAVIENLVLESDNFMPNVLEVASENYVRWGRKKVANKHKHAIEVKVSGIQTDLRDVSYYVKRKEGFPPLTDTGVADILLAGDGFSFKLKLSTPDEKDSQNFFKINKVDVDIKHLSIKLHQSKHKLLFSLFKPLMLNVLRPALQKVLEKTIREQVDRFDTLLYQVKVEADRALEEAENDPHNVPNLYSRYAQAAQKRFLQSKKKAEQVAADKKVNYAVTQEESMFPDIHLPGGISSKATEYKQMAREGEKWESPVFSIGASHESSDAPSAPNVTRKAKPFATTAHTTTTATTTMSASNGSVKIADLNDTLKLPVDTTNINTSTTMATY